jgi:serine protease AprX
MKNTLLLLVILIISAYPQVNDAKLSRTIKQSLTSISADEDILVWVFFTDKGEQRMLLKKPENVVSSKSLKRRSKVFPLNSLITNDDLPVSSDYINQLEAIGFTVKQKSKWFNGVSGTIRRSDLSNISSLAFVKEIDLVAKLKRVPEQPAEQTVMKNTEAYNSLNFNYGSSLTQVQQINVPALHNLGFYGQGVTIV